MDFHFPAEKAFLLLPAIGAMGYVIIFLLFKRAMELGAGPLRTAMLGSVLMGVVYSPLLFWSGDAFSSSLLIPAAVIGLAWLVGKLFVITAIQHGDVSIATPLLGTKVVLVAGMTTLLTSEPVDKSLWISATLATLSLMLLQAAPAKKRRQALKTIVCAFLAASCFALSDVLLQKWAPDYGIFLFLPVVFLWNAFFSLFLIPFFQKTNVFIPQKARGWLTVGLLLQIVFVFLIAGTIGHFGHATEINIVYSTRGLWSIVLVWVAGHWFGNEERHAGWRIMTLRLIGAALLLAAIILIVMS